MIYIQLYPEPSGSCLNYTTLLAYHYTFMSLGVQSQLIQQPVVVQSSDTVCVSLYGGFTMDSLHPSYFQSGVRLVFINMDTYHCHPKNLQNLHSIANLQIPITLLEYNPRNMEYFQKNITYTHVTCIFTPFLASPYFYTLYRQMPNKTIDVLLLGSMNDRRRNVLDELQAKGYTVVSTWLNDFPTQQDYVGKAKVVLQMVYYEQNDTFDYYRNNAYLSAGCLLVQETPKYIDLELEPYLKGWETHFLHASYENLPDYVSNLLDVSDEYRNAMAKQQSEWYKGIGSLEESIKFLVPQQQM